MKLLLDTHAVVWWWLDDPRLPGKTRAMIADASNTILVSAASAWELATKNRVGKWPEVETIVRDFTALLRRSRFIPLAISVEDAQTAGAMAGPHRDPFDRMLIAQANAETAVLVSRDAVLRDYGVDVIWD